MTDYDRAFYIESLPFDIFIRDIVPVVGARGTHKIIIGLGLRLPPKVLKVQATRNRASKDAKTTVQNWVDENPDTRLVLEIATRAHAQEFREPPRNLGIATDVIANPTNSQYPV